MGGYKSHPYGDKEKKKVKAGLSAIIPTRLPSRNLRAVPMLATQ